MFYYYNEALRWSFGFDNPNKAGAFIATVLPLFWLWLVLSFRVSIRGWRVLLLCLAFVGLESACWFLFKTYSRGGLVAGVSAFAYIGWMYRGRWGWSVWWIAGIAMSLLFASGLGSRSLEKAADASTGNRLLLWKGGLQMLADRPLGVGWGNSGYEYMQWYQPLEIGAGYRTLVNSYLTFAVEGGIFLSGLIFAGVFFLVLWTRPARSGQSQEGGRAGFATWVACRAALLAFAFAGFFSTTMEEPLLWIAPLGCLAYLIFPSIRSAGRISTGVCALQGLGFSFVLIIFLWSAGCYFNSKDSLCRGFDSRRGQVLLKPRGSASPNKLWVWADERILGDASGRPLRKLCSDTGLFLNVGSIGQDGAIPADARVLVMGGQVSHVNPVGVGLLVLLCPGNVSEERALELLGMAKYAILMLPESGARGNIEWWRDLALRPDLREKTEVEMLPLVSERVDVAWDRVIHLLRKAGK
ncbi:MAG: O-antigen ligase family protein [Methylacidiphilales bacterium]|nr:O-antigen ligase family protein [Candidatus Methylacidiphilales bacterium]